MKQLSIPYLSGLKSATLAMASDLMDDYGNRASIESVNWSKAYGYMPITFFTIARSLDALYLKFQVRGNVLRAVHSKDQTAVWEDSCVGFYCEQANATRYSQIDFNCIGTCYAAYRYNDGHVELFNEEDLERIERESSLDTKPFNELDGMFNWALIIKIPLDLLGLDAHALPPYIRANFIKCADGKGLKH